MRQNDDIKEVRPERGQPAVSPGQRPGYAGNKRHEATSMLTRLSLIANPYIQWKSFYRS